jgi:hypothetical protein
MQIIISEVVRKFAFSLPDNVAIQPTFAITLVPMTADGPKLPLRVSRLQ